MVFILHMSARELRASWRRLLFFFTCVAIGVGAIVALRSIIQSVRQGLVQEARTMIAADVLVQTNRPWTPEVLARVEEHLAAAPVLERTDSIETATMVRAEHGTSQVARMVELRGLEAAFPFYGTLGLQGGRVYDHSLLANRGALAGADLLAQLDVAEGDRLIIAGHPFTINGVIEHEPGRRVGAFTFGARVLVDLEDLRSTGLLTFGSRASYQILLRVRDDGVEPLTRRLRRELRDDFVIARSYKSLEDDIGEDLLRAENYLSLVGFVIVVLGGIGVWSVTRVFVRQKIRSVAILKCVGATTRQVLATYVLQVVLLGLAGSLLGVALAALGISVIPASLAESFGGVAYGLTGSAVVQGVTVGLLVSLLFALVPLLEVRRVKPLLLLRGGGDAVPPPGQDARGAGPKPGTGRWVRELPTRAMAAGRSIDWLQAGAGVLVMAALVVVASWQAASVRAGGIVSIGFAAVALTLYGAAWAVVRAVMPLASAPWFPLRHAVISLRRPGNQTRVILLAVGLGSFFVLGVRALQQNLVSEFAVELDRRGADMFLIDIQRDQVDGVRALLAERVGEYGRQARLVPVLRARVTGVRGGDVNLESYADVRGRGSLAREYVITYRGGLEENEQITKGAFWDSDVPLAPDAEQEVSIEQSIHERFDIGVGDRMRFDVLGRTLEARVTSVRRVEWEDSRSGGFMFVFRPGALSAAPHTFIGFVRGPADTTARARLQHALVTRYPNVTAIDGREILARVRRVVDNVILAISIVGGVALLGGVLILIGAVAMTKFQRVYEAAILRTLGASTRLLGTMLALEYCTLGLLAGLIGALGALGLSWAVTRHLFDIPWRPAPGLLAAGAALTMLLVGAVGVIASADVLRKKPLSTLRAE
ncbi:MAG TPA: FtsX-like permease family protein [Vicinamibacterales bacterium]|nr:FtsX-like permease family protein [Vicinamibacterales bacterium]